MRKTKRSSRYKNPAFQLALGAHFKKIRIKKGYSIDRLSKEGEQISPAAIQRLETGQADVQVSLLYRLANILEVSLLDFFRFDYLKIRDSQDLIIPFEDGEKPPKNTIPFYTLEVAAGIFSSETESVNPAGWIELNKKGSLKDYFALQISGKSMEPTIKSGSICLFKKYSGGSRNGQIMLVQARGVSDSEHGGKYVIKRYQRITPVQDSASRKNVIVHLLSDNPSFSPIVLKNISEEEISTPAVFVEVLS
ncbi:MAG: S24 family peptidase [Bdellovibrionota bacterium]